MPEYFLPNRSVTLRPADVVGKGGEADIYRKGGEAYKVFKSPSHPDLVGSPMLQKEARERIAEHQKKLPAFPKNLPSRIASPGELLLDKNGGIVGYQMEFIENGEVLLRYGERSFREQGISDDDVRVIFMDLHKTVCAAHAVHFSFGDFNDLNVLITGKEAQIIDADSGQFGRFMARMFTTKFVDPLICDPKENVPLMIRPHSPETDWYAYLVMLMQSLLFVGPYGGVYRPKDQSMQVPHDGRPLKRITVFNHEVRYPKPARPYKILPDELLGYFERTFVNDARGVPPLSLVENLRFTTCSTCGMVHARGQCPECAGVTPVMVKEIHTGTVKGTKVFEAFGSILFAAMQDGHLRFLYYTRGAYKREDDRTVVEAPLDPNTRFRIRGADTLLARGRQCFVFEGKGSHIAPSGISVDSYGLLPLIDANGANLFFVEGGGLYRSSELGGAYREKVGDVLPNQTLFWVGDALGFGFYRAAELSNFFVFRPDHRGINDSVNVPGIRGQLVDSTCVFGHDRIWFFTVSQEGNSAVNRCFLVDAQGALLGSAVGTPGDGSWLGKIRGACAARDFLLVPTDDGVVRVALTGNSLGVVKEYPDTHRFVDAEAHLFISNEGLTVVRRHDIWRLVIG